MSNPIPERVFGSAGAFWMKSGVAIGPIFSLTGKKKTHKEVSYLKSQPLKPVQF